MKLPTLPHIPSIFSSYFKKREKIAGLSVHTSSLRVLLLEDKGNNEFFPLYSKTIPLPPNTIVRGELKNPKAFLAALNQIKDLQEFTKELTLCISDILSFSTVLSIPSKTPLKQIPGIVRSKLEVQSPIPPDQSLFDWEEYIKKSKDKKEIQVTVGIKNKITAYLTVLARAGFETIIIETFTQSIHRALGKGKGTGLFIFISNWGIEISILKEGLIIFQHSEMLGVEAKKESKKERTAIASEVRKVVEYYLSEHPKEKITNFRIIQEKPDPQLPALIEKSLGIHVLTDGPKISLGKKPTPFLEDDQNLIVLGSALRGTIPRAQDTHISLAPIGTEALWAQDKILAFSRIVSDFIIIICVVFILIFGGSWAYLNFFAQRAVQVQLEVLEAQIKTSETLKNINELQTNITAFNQKVYGFNSINARVPDWPLAIGDITSRIRPGIAINSISLNTESGAAQISGQAKTISDLIDFKNVISFSGLYEVEIKIPLSYFERGIDLPLSYTLTLKDPSVIFPYGL